MEISGSCSSSPLAAAQVEATLMPAPKCQARSHGGLAGEVEPLSTHRNPGC